MTFGGCKQDFMLVVGQNMGTNTPKDKATVKHLFAMDASKVRPLYSDLPSLNASGWNRNFLRLSLKRTAAAHTDTPFPSFSFHQQVRGITLLIASYINGAHLQKATAHHMSAPALMAAQPISLKSKELRSKSPPALGRPSKTPTLLWCHTVASTWQSNLCTPRRPLPSPGVLNVHRCAGFSQTDLSIS